MFVQRKHSDPGLLNNFEILERANGQHSFIYMGR